MIEYVRGPGQEKSPPEVKFKTEKLTRTSAGGGGGELLLDFCARDRIPAMDIFFFF